MSYAGLRKNFIPVATLGSICTLSLFHCLKEQH